MRAPAPPRGRVPLAAKLPPRVNKQFPGIGALLAIALLLPSGGSAATEPSIEDLILAADDMLRGESSESRITMRIKTKRWQRELRLYILSEGSEKFLARIEAPAKERGTATLKVEQNIWNYLPKVDRTIKVPSSMLSAGWMGSHFTNDDLVRESRYSEDFDCEFLERPEGSSGHWVVRCTPRPDAPVVWGAVDIRFRAEDQLPDRVEFLDERTELVRTVQYEDIGRLGGKTLPRRIRVFPADDSEEFTEIVYEEMAFDIDLPPGTFSLQSLRQ